MQHAAACRLVSVNAQSHSSSLADALHPTRTSARSCRQAEMEGLAVVIIDALTRREWVQEDYVPQAIDGAPDLRVRYICTWGHCWRLALASTV